MGKEIFVTGASGFIGSALIRALRLRFPDATIKGLVRSEASGATVVDAGATPVIGDLRSIDTFGEHLLEAAWVFHIGGNATFSDTGDYEESNVNATREILSRLSGSTKLSKIVFTSSIGAVDRTPTDPCSAPLDSASPQVPVSAYGQSKLQCEEMIRTSGLPYVILRPSWVYGPGMRRDSHIAVLTEAAIHNKPLSRLLFPGKVSVIYIDDMVEALIESALSDSMTGRTDFVDDGTPRSLGEIFSKGRELSEVRSLALPIPAWSGAILRPLYRYIPFKVKCLVADVLVCSNSLASFSHFRPKITFDEGMRRTWSYVKNTDRGVHLVTGAASGIGRAFAERLSEEGKRLLLVDRNTAVEEVARTLGQSSVVVDLANRDFIAPIQEWIVRDRSFIEGLINCAGFGVRGPVEEHSDDQIADMINVNIGALVRLCRLVLPEMRKRRVGYIINVASSISYVPLPGMALYAATKAAVLSFGKSLWGELQGLPIKILTVCPSGTRTSFQESAGVKVVGEGKGLMPPEEVVAMAMKALDEGRIGILIGWKSKLLIFVGRCLPTSLEVLYWKAMMGVAR